MKFGVVVFPGSNCDRDIHDALTYELNQDVIMLWHKDKDLSMFSTGRLYHITRWIFLWRLPALRSYCKIQPDDAKCY
jgi:Phosphoribosylformylglycinamidine (FGAM) synthase, glutamine amidotransferase domain